MSTVTNKDMRTAFWAQANGVLENVFSTNGHTVGPTIGAELEMVLFKSNRAGQPRLVSQHQRDQLLAYAGPDVTVELGAADLELNPGPVNLATDGFAGMLTQLSGLFASTREIARNMDLEIGPWGSVPFAASYERTSTLKYKLVPDFHNAHRVRRTPRLAGIDVTDAGIESMLHSAQFSMQAKSLSHGILLLNRMFALSPIATALAANARFLLGQDTGWADCRMEVWRRSHEASMYRVPRVGLPTNYFGSVQEYLEDVASYPFILGIEEAALGIGIGLYWKVARLKFARSSQGFLPLVEFRPMSIQPTIKENVAMFAFMVGRILFAEDTNESLPPMTTVAAAQHLSERFGVRAFSSSCLRTHVSNALTGLKTHDLLPDPTVLDVESILLKKAQLVSVVA